MAKAKLIPEEPGKVGIAIWSSRFSPREEERRGKEEHGITKGSSILKGRNDIAPRVSPRLVEGSYHRRLRPHEIDINVLLA